MKALNLNNYSKAKILNKVTVGVCVIAVIALIIITASGCKRSLTQGIIFSVGTSNFKYTALVQVRDAGNANIAPGNLTVSVSGANAGMVYDLTTGKKKLAINPDGTIQLVISPTAPLTAPVTFDLNISSPGYFPLIKSVTVTPRDSSQIVKIDMQSASSPVEGGGTTGVAQFALVNGVLPQQTVAKIGSDNSFKATTSVNKVTTNAIRRLSDLGNGSTPADQITYYDDGLTSIVLPKGTTFHYWELIQTGTVTDTVNFRNLYEIPGTGKDIAITGVASGTIHVDAKYEVYYVQEIETHPVYAWVEKALTGAAASTDSIAAVVTYAPGNNISTKISLANQPAPTIHTSINNQDVLEDELLFNTVVTKKLYGNPVFWKIHHETKKSWYDATTNTVHKNETVPPFIVYDYVISPDQSAQWFTSFVINPNAINPNTMKPIASGDLVEIGVGGTDTTLTETVRKADNGQLRVQMLSYDAGFFFKAPYIANFNYNINLNTTLVDPENSNCVVSLLGGNFGFSFVGSNYSSGYSIAGKIASVNPINTNSTSTAYYWGKQMGATQSYGLNAVVTPFGFQPPNPKTSFMVYYTDDTNLKDKIITTKEAVSGKNYGAVTAYTDATTLGYGSGEISIRDGRWATNAFPGGATITGNGFIDGYPLTLTYQVLPGTNYLYWESPKWN